MPPDLPSPLWSDEFAHEVRTAITSMKLHAHLIRRVAWPTSSDQHRRLHERATALRHFNRLLEEHATRWPDGRRQAQEQPGADPTNERESDAPRDGPLGAASS